MKLLNIFYKKNKKIIFSIIFNLTAYFTMLIKL